MAGTEAAQVDERTSLLLVSTLTHVWSAIRQRHPEVPGVILLAAPASRGNVLGHFAALRWSGKKAKEKLVHEVVVVAEYLDRPAAEILGTLLHEAAHAANFEAGIKDCSKSQYHNKRFKEAAEKLGLEVEQMPNYGWAHTRLTTATTVLYREELALLEPVLVHRQRLVSSAGTKTKTPSDEEGEDKPCSRSRKAVCACPFIIRVSKKTIEETVIVCRSCDEPFRLA